MTPRRDRLPHLVALLFCGLTALAAPARAAGGGLEIVPDGPLLLLLLVAFALLIYPMNALLFRPIFRVLDAREEKISGTRRRAEHLAREADATAQRYENAIAKSREESHRERAAGLEEARRAGAGQTTAARKAAETEIERARAEMASALAEARTALRADSQALAREAAARLLGRSL